MIGNNNIYQESKTLPDSEYIHVWKRNVDYTTLQSGVRPSITINKGSIKNDRQYYETWEKLKREITVIE